MSDKLEIVLAVSVVLVAISLAVFIGWIIITGQSI